MAAKYQNNYKKGNKNVTMLTSLHNKQDQKKQDGNKTQLR